jgi:predicted nucleic acid-binding protein
VTLYLDASSLVKLYVVEPASDDVRQSLAPAEVAATSQVTYAEARAAFARRYRQRTLTSQEFRRVKHDFDGDWPLYLRVDVSAAVCKNAGDLAERYRLRGFDAIHLASFLQLAREGRDVEFSSFDSRLNRAAASVLRSLKRAR